MLGRPTGSGGQHAFPTPGSQGALRAEAAKAQGRSERSSLTGGRALEGVSSSVGGR